LNTMSLNALHHNVTRMPRSISCLSRKSQVPVRMLAWRPTVLNLISLFSVVLDKRCNIILTVGHLHFLSNLPSAIITPVNLTLDFVQTDQLENVIE
jgi:hypothetical protein